MKQVEDLNELIIGDTVLWTYRQNDDYVISSFEIVIEFEDNPFSMTFRKIKTYQKLQGDTNIINKNNFPKGILWQCFKATQEEADAIHLQENL